MNVQTDYSILQCLIKPDKIVKTCKEYGYTKLILCDRNSMSAMVEFYEACKDEKNNVKPILGTCLKVCEMDSTIKEPFNTFYNICLVAKNEKGYRNLLKIISLANDHTRVLETKYQKLARFHLDDIKGLTDGVSCVLADGSEWEFHPVQYTLDKYKAVFSEVLTNQEIYWSDVRYIDKEQEEDWEVQQCILLKCLLSELPNKAKEVGSPFKRDNSLPLYKNYVADPRFKRTEEFLDSCEDYEILSKPKVPKFDCPDGMSQEEYFTELCRSGWKRRFKKWDSPEKKNEYANRVKYEMGVLQSCELDGYFLVVQDYINWAKRQGWFVGHSRGCLDKNVRIIVKGGVKTLEDISIGDEVVSQSGDFNKVKNKFVYDCNEDLLKINTYYGDKDGITLTKDHKVLVSRCVRLKPKFNNPKKEKQYDSEILDLEWIRADEIKLGDLIFTPKVNNRIIKEPEEIDLSEFSNETNLIHDEEYCYHHRINGLTKRINEIWKYPRFIKCDSEFYYLLGVFTGDGWLFSNTKNKFGLCFNTDDVSDIDRILRYLDKMGWTYTKRYEKNRKLLQIHISCHHFTSFLAKIFDKYRFTSQTKHCPDFIKFVSNTNISHYLSGYMSADGSLASKIQCSTSTSSIDLYNDVKYLYVLLGFPVCSSSLKRKADKRGYKTGIEYRISLSNRKCLGSERDYQQTYQWKDLKAGYLTRVRKISVINSIKQVYDLEIENESNYLTTSGLVHNSSGGCLTAYLLGITEIDPIPHNLLFERFYSADRSAGGIVSLPDIDTDFPKYKREKVVEYVEEKYTRERVAHIATFGTLKGSGALTEVLRVHDVFDYAMIKSMTRKMPAQDKVVDQMEEQGEHSLIRFTLKNYPDVLRNLGELDGENIVGENSYHLEQAIRLEGVIRGVGIHASGILISDENIEAVCPLMLSNDGTSKVAGVEMSAAEKLGLVKVDILGTEVLDKAMEISNLLLGISEDQ